MRQLISVLVLVVASATANASQDDLIPTLVRDSVDWEARWYGITPVRRCLASQTASEMSIRALVRKETALVGYNCTTGAPIHTEIRTFDAVMPQAAIFFTGSLDVAPRADLSDGETNRSCSITEDDLRTRAQSLMNDGVLARVRWNAVHSESEPTAPLRQFAIRTMKIQQQIHGLKPPTSIRIGYVAVGDPYLLVQVASTNEIHLLAMPDEKRLADPNYCGMVYSAARFQGRDSKPKLIDSSAPRFKAKSVLVPAQ
jgi:hypothetical protein